MVYFHRAFQHPNTAQSFDGQPLDLAALERRFPTLANTTAHDKLTASYRVISTSETISGLAQAGFNLHFAQVQRKLDAANRPFAKHLLRFRTGQVARNVGDYVPELIAINSHDGSSGWQIIAGMFRLVCMNGLMTGTAFDTVRVRHIGNVTTNVIDGMTKAATAIDSLSDRIDAYKAKTLSLDATLEFARRAYRLRHPLASTMDATRVASSTLRAQRNADTGTDLWTVYNRVQENLIRGNGYQIDARGNLLRSRAVTGINASVKLNRGLSDLADEFLLAA